MRVDDELLCGSLVEVLVALRRGVELEDGWTAPARVSLVGPSTLRITIDQQDGASGLRNEFYSLVRGTIGDSMTVNGKTMQAIDPTKAAHSFAVPELGVNVPLLAVDSTAPAGSSNKIVFSFKVPASGIYHWQCFVPCGAGTLYGLGGPMQTLGYMDGQIEVGS